MSCWAWINYKEIQRGVAEAVAPLIKQVKGSHSLKGFYLLTCENGSTLQLEIALCSIGWDCLVKWVREGSKNSCVCPRLFIIACRCNNMREGVSNLRKTGHSHIKDCGWLLVGDWTVWRVRHESGRWSKKSWAMQQGQKKGKYLQEELNQPGFHSRGVKYCLTVEAAGVSEIGTKCPLASVRRQPWSRKSSHMDPLMSFKSAVLLLCMLLFFT